MLWRIAVNILARFGWVGARRARSSAGKATSQGLFDTAEMCPVWFVPAFFFQNPNDEREGCGPKHVDQWNFFPNKVSQEIGVVELWAAVWCQYNVFECHTRRSTLQAIR